MGRLPGFLLLSVLVHALLLSLAWQRSTPQPAPATQLALHLIEPTARRLSATPSSVNRRAQLHRRAHAAKQPPHAIPRTKPASRPRHIEATAPATTGQPTTTGTPPPHRALASQTAAAAKLAAAVPRRTATAPATSSAATRARLHRLLARQLAFHHYYPPLARRRGWQGRVRVGVRVQADGRLSDIRVLHTSGYALLDQAAIHSLRSIHAVHAAQRWLNGHHFDIVLPVVYKLLDG